MTFEGQTYSSMLDLEMLIIVWEANLKALEVEYKYLTVIKDKKALDEVSIKINCYIRGLEELKKLNDDLTTRFNVMIELMNSLDGKIFLMKFKEGKDNQEIMSELHLSDSTYYRHLDKIVNLLSETKYGNEIKEWLKE